MTPPDSMLDFFHYSNHRSSFFINYAASGILLQQHTVDLSTLIQPTFLINYLTQKTVIWLTL